ncbi:MbtH family protein [Amycolatopsis anabasis]|uniref:MbtH family protein n=1 Tax=Amycolatopsis anabasis TaxID=1840409 RepID=UPI00131D0437|nr:MbtH family protein [Amycolatopsis anabasis]
MTNPFDNQDGTFLALVNAEEQYCIWPAFAEVPAGWTVVLGESTREQTLAHVSENWTDLRPASLRES